MRGNIPRDTHSVRDIETDPSFELYDKDLFVLNGVSVIKHNVSRLSTLVECND